ncbi:MAG: zinc-binding dehydrogenase [Actinobacteria bacterium]|nr:zinc-binding dehydrogenase [Actinomycetota bacterium]
MRQVLVPRFGGPEVFEVQTADDPEPEAGEVRVRVHGAGVNFADVSARAGLYQDAPPAPLVVGYEVAGIVDKVGANTGRLHVGDKVAAVTRFGGYSDVVAVPELQAAKLPDDADLVKAACIPVAYLTAYMMLNRLGSVRTGETVLIHSAGGGVGLAALQLAKGLGAVTIGTASAKKHERLHELGLDHSIDYRTQDFETEVKRLTGGRGVDVALDAQGGASFRKSYRSLAPMGRLFLFGLASGNAPTRKDAWKTVPKMLATTPFFHPFSLMNNNRGVFGVNMAHLWDEGDLITETLDELIAMWARHEIDPIIDTTFPFEYAGDAHQRLEQAQNFGKVVLVP